MKILVTGGMGYIGSHTVVELLKCGHEPIIVDNLSNSSAKVLDRISLISGSTVKFFKADMLDKRALETIFEENNFDCVMHFAGLKAVSESIQKPLTYYYNNVVSTLNLLEAMISHGVKSIVFSSSATVYGEANMPLNEDCGTGKCFSPYGASKLMAERLLTDAAKVRGINVVILRYFNPIGAHESGLIGESPLGKPNNLMPYLTQVAVGQRSELGIFGNDYDTKDGTCIRDYIHVVDLAKAHVKALDKRGVNIYNLGTGKGYSVLEVVQSFSRVNGVEIPYRFMPRRSGDVPILYCCPDKAKRELSWEAEFGIDDMCRDSYNFQKKNRRGYE